MIRMDPIAFTYLLIVSLLLIIFMHLMRQSEIFDIPVWIFQVYGVFMGLMFLWWPIDLLINWEKRTLAFYEKDKYLIGVVLAIVTQVLLVFLFRMNWQVAMGIACGVGATYPVGVLVGRWYQTRRIDIDPKNIRLLASQSPRYQEFLQYFPHANQYAIGLNSNDGNRAHLLLHSRQPCDEAPRYQIDFVMDIPVDRLAVTYVGGQERLSCYLFCNEEGRACIGFLPSANIGRALDYGFSDEELERALEEARSPEQNWAPLGDDPLIIRHYPGRAVRVG